MWTILYNVINCCQSHTSSEIVDKPIQCHILLSIQYNVRNCWQSHTMSGIVDIPIQCQKLLTFPCNVRNCSQSHTMSGIIDSHIRCQKFVCNPIMSEIVDKSIQCQTLTILYNVPESWHSNINSSMYIRIKCILCSYNCLYHVESLV